VPPIIDKSVLKKLSTKERKAIKDMAYADFFIEKAFTDFHNEVYDPNKILLPSGKTIQWMK
jgi:hypothetical protein